MKMFTMFCAAVLAVCGVASAQAPASLVKVHFDHAVTVGSVELPAGDLTIQETTSGASGQIMLLVRSESGAQTLVLANRIHPATPRELVGPSVVLRRHGNAFILRRIWLDDHSGFEVME